MDQNLAPALPFAAKTEQEKFEHYVAERNRLALLAGLRLASGEKVGEFILSDLRWLQNWIDAYKAK